MSLLISPAYRAIDANGDPLPGAKFHFYETGTSTPATVYTDAALSSAHTNPVVADSGGLFPPVFGDSSISYRAILKTSDGVTIQDIDPIGSAITGQPGRVLGFDTNGVAGPVSSVNLGTLPSGATNVNDLGISGSADASGTTQFYSFVNRVYGTGSNNFDYIRANYSGTHVETSAGTTNVASGLHQYLWLAGAGNVTFGNVIETHIRIDSSGGITNQVNNFNVASISFLGTGTANIVTGYNANQIGHATKTNTAYSFNAQHTDAAVLAVNFRSEMTLAANRWGFLQAGGASNGYAGKSKFGAVTTPTEAVDVNGNILANGTIRSTGGKIGYDPGAGGTTTQLTSKSTGVTSDHPSGQITMHNAALAANTIVTFTLTNSFIAANDDVRVWVKGGNASAGSYRVAAEGNAAGSRTIVVENKTGGSLGEALVLGFAVYSGAVA